MIRIEPLQPEHAPATRAFLERIPLEDQSFFKEDISRPDTVDRWLAGEAGHRAVALEGSDGEDCVRGYFALVAGAGLSSHVAELRLVTDPQRRRRGYGRLLARAALIGALERGIEKIVVEVAADEEPAIALFRGLGFEGEALLRNHIRDRQGRRRDVLILAHLVDETWSSMASLGIDEAL
jgi:ribosomal protein S18 acetylase RimI-like enzyme